jgi:hypothetical protein
VVARQLLNNGTGKIPVAVATESHDVNSRFPTSEGGE